MKPNKITLASGIIFALIFGRELVATAFAQYNDIQTRTYAREAIAKGQVREALAYFENEALAAEKANRWDRAALCYDEASRAARFLGQLQKALSFGHKALETAQKGKDTVLQSAGMNRIVQALQQLGKRTEARDWIFKGIESTNQIPAGPWRDGSLANFHNLLGRDLLRTGEIKKAIEHLEQSVQLREGLVAYNRRIGNARYVRSNLDTLVYDLQGLGVAYQRARMFDEAIQTHEKSLTIIRQNQSQSFRAGESHLSLGTLYLQRKDPARAKEHFELAFASATKLQLSYLLVSSGVQLGNLSLQQNNPSEAVDYYKTAIATIESSRAQIQSEELRKSYFENQGNAYVGIIRASLSASKPDDAFDFNERARSRAFLDILGTKVQLGKAASLVEEEKRLQARIAALGARAGGQRREDEPGEEQESVTPARQRQELAAAEKAYADFLAKVRKENKEQASLMNVEPLTLKQVQELLDPGVTLLEYFVTPDGLILWIVEKDKVASVTVPLRRGQLQARVSAFREAIQQFEETDKFKQQAGALYKQLIQPALAHVKGKELLVIPHDVLHYLPFQALLAPDGQYLIEKYPINYLSSASLMQFTQEKRKARGELTSVLAKGGSVLALGNPDLNDRKMALQFAEIEAKEIKTLYPQSTVYLNKEASEAKAKELSSQNDIVHFATHAELNESDPLASAILLAKDGKEDGRLEVREIFGMDLKASLVVLSACETGLGKLSSGDELVGLTRAFIYAGTPSVVASLWNVEDSSTAQLMASFYKNLKTMTKVEALRQAQLQLIQGKTNSELLTRRGIGGVGRLGETPDSAPPRPSPNLPAPSPELSAPLVVSTSHPYFWAPFILVGDGK